MAETTSIEWTDATWNPITGCTLVSEGCKHCYAATLAAGRMQHHPSRAGLARRNAAGEAKFTGEVRFNEQWLDEPLRWRRSRMIFVVAHGDLFHEAVPDEWIDRVFAVMALAPQHTFQVLTKRPERMRAYMGRRDDRGRVPALDYALLMAATGRWNTDLRGGWPLANVWLGTSVEDQAAADARVPHLLETPAAIRFASYEPALGPVNFRQIWAAMPGGGRTLWDALAGGRVERMGQHNAAGLWDEGDYMMPVPRLDWIICGGESGRGARPMHPDWARKVRDDCVAAGVAFLFKQWGAWVPVSEFDDVDDLYHSAPANDPEASRRCRVANLVMHRDGSVYGRGSAGDFHAPIPLGAFGAGTGAMTMFDVGKKAAGRLLDGREHNGMPGARP